MVSSNDSTSFLIPFALRYPTVFQSPSRSSPSHLSECTIMRRVDPSRQPVRNVARVTRCAAALTQVSRGSDTSSIIHPCRSVETAHVCVSLLLQTLLQPIARRSSGSSVLDHLINFGIWARCLHNTVIDNAWNAKGCIVSIASSGPVVRLHETGIKNGVLGRDDANTARGLLHRDRQNQSLVHTGGRGDGLDGRFYIGDFFVAIVGYAPLRARRHHVRRVCFEPGLRLIFSTFRVDGWEAYIYSKLTH